LDGAGWLVGHHYSLKVSSRALNESEISIHVPMPSTDLQQSVDDSGWTQFVGVGQAVPEQFDQINQKSVPYTAYVYIHC
jgi:hypothetical protein